MEKTRGQIFKSEFLPKVKPFPGVRPLFERMRRDGYGIFTPPESRYDLAQARRHIRANSSPFVEEGDTGSATDAKAGADPFPSLDWLTRMLERVPRETLTTLVMPPIHVAAQAAPDTADAVRERACTARILDLAAKHGATVVDYRRPSAITTEDSNYWDPLHYRVGLAARIVDDIAAVSAGGGNAGDGTYRVVRPSDNPGYAGNPLPMGEGRVRGYELSGEGTSPSPGRLSPTRPLPLGER